MMPRTITLRVLAIAPAVAAGEFLNARANTNVAAAESRQ